MSVNKIQIQLRYLMVCATLCSANLCTIAQYTAYDFISKKSAWVKSENPTGILAIDTLKMAFAEVNYTKNNGSFVNYFESDNSFQYGATCESFYRLSPKTTVYGKVLYSKFRGKNMGGSNVIDPYYNPFDIVEFADSTAGQKYNETYFLEGSLSTQLSKRLLLGIHIDYKNVSYFKTKDLRHTNDLMDMKLSAGLQYNNNIIQAGLLYAYRRTTESIFFQSSGNKDQQFNSLINYGAFFGLQERFGENGYTESADTKPFFDAFHTVGAQIMLFPQQKINYYNEISVSLRKGYYGKNSSTSIRYTEHNAELMHYMGILAYNTNKSLHQLKLYFDSERLENAVNIYKEETTTGGNTITKYYGQNKVLNRGTKKFRAAYEANINIQNNLPQFIFNLSIEMIKKESTTTIYPAYRKQQIDIWQMSVQAGRNVVSGKNTYTIFAGSIYGEGNGDYYDGTYNASSTAKNVVIDRYLLRELEFLTAQRIEANTGFRYSRDIPNQKIKLYAEVSGSKTHAFQIKYIGSFQHSFGLKIGCQF